MLAAASYHYIRFLFKKLNINEAVREALKVHAVQIEGLNLKQLNQGIDSTGDRITPNYTDYTVQRKVEKGQPTDRVTLKDTGDFYESIFIEVFKNAFQIDATDEKTEGLKYKYGNEVLGLTQEHIKEVARIIKPTLEKILEQQLKRIAQNAPKTAVAA